MKIGNSVGCEKSEKTVPNRVSDFKDFRVPEGARVVAFCCTEFWNVGDCCQFQFAKHVSWLK